MGRTVKHVGARTVADDSSKVLALVPLFLGETVDKIKLDCYAAGLQDTDVSNPILMEWVGLAIPWPIVAIADEVASGAQADFSTVADFDQLFHQFLLSADEDGSEYYGGDVDLDPEETTLDDDAPAEDELIDGGMIGSYVWHRQAVLGRPYAAAGNDTIRFGDDFRAVKDSRSFKKASYGQLLLFGMVRNKVATETNFNIQKDDATSIRAQALLKGGDYARIRQKIATDTSAFGDWIRTVLFGGDQYVEASTLVTTSVKAYALMDTHISGPLSRKMGQR